MRKHIVNCQIEGDVMEAKKRICQITGEIYVEALEHTLEQSGWTKDMQVEFIDKMINFVEKNREGTCEVK